MKVCARSVDLSQCPAAVARFAVPGQVFVTAEQHYDVCAVALFDGQALLQLVDDLRYPAWLPAWLFDVLDHSIPRDWICSIFPDEPKLVLGPHFLAKDHEAYASMVELESSQVDRFWERIQLQQEADKAEQEEEQ